MRGYLPLIRKNSSTHMCGLAVYVKEGLSFALDLSLENSPDSSHNLDVFDWLYLTQCLTSFSSINHLLHLWAQFLILFYLFYFIILSANVFVFRDFNVHHKDWLTYSGGTDRPGKLCYNFSISNDLTQMVNFPTCIPDCDSHNSVLLNLFVSSDASICSTMGFPLLGNSDHVFASVSTDFPSYSKWYVLFHRIAYGYSRADWDDLHDHLRCSMGRYL